MEAADKDEYVVVAWARKNDRGDLYDLSLHFNQFTDQNIIVPLYMKKEKPQES